MVLLTEELAKERVRDREREIELLHAAARVRAMRRTRREAHIRVARVRRILLSR